MPLRTRPRGLVRAMLWCFLCVLVPAPLADRGFNWLLVGAPDAQTPQPNVDRGGAVFRCSTEASGSCQPVPFDQNGPTEVLVDRRRERTDDKSGQWFGATLHSSGDDGLIVACAPRYVYFSINHRRREPVGTCFVSHSFFSNITEFSPCKTSAWGYHRQGSCQAGFSAAISKDKNRLYIGAPGSWYWQGQVFMQDLNNVRTRLNTSESPSSDDDSFLGYSTAAGKFSGSSDYDVAVGMPRGEKLSGKASNTFL
ncbi:hypothetical protein MRX96_057445 [Rhipicephalus microplus]